MTVTTDCILKNETSWRELEKDLKIRKFLIVPTQTLVGFNSTSWNEAWETERNSL